MGDAERQAKGLTTAHTGASDMIKPSADNPSDQPLWLPLNNELGRAMPTLRRRTVAALAASGCTTIADVAGLDPKAAQHMVNMNQAGWCDLAIALAKATKA